MSKVLKPLSRVLRIGLPGRCPVRHEDQRILELIGAEVGDSVEVPYDRISSSDWGYVYERVVGCEFERRGYTVYQRGIELQLLDQGIDIVAELPGSSDAFIQCKSGGGRIGPQAIEKILYAGGNFIHRHRRYKRSELILAVPDIAKACTPFNVKRLLSRNQNPYGVKISVVEIPWILSGSPQGSASADQA